MEAALSLFDQVQVQLMEALRSSGCTGALCRHRGSTSSALTAKAAEILEKSFSLYGSTICLELSDAYAPVEVGRGACSRSANAADDSMEPTAASSWARSSSSEVAACAGGE
eukprot:CAMPEP_0182849232 /NCGR_PEP_ID=MMETSP0006_2-20121128/29446_1 /TAXON_ID=97485 /ORGANISM="Prymnesium parvum, Strain Texoma1" /LENGTH=110 /DNA_ID=CAMNT_0024979747 /DNA_START=383 /DNA_END=716 /DNA_ORIENTATION=-